MGEIEVKLDVLKACAGALEHASGSLGGKKNEIAGISMNLSLPRESARQIRQKLQSITGSLEEKRRQLNALKNALDTIGGQYRTTENQIAGTGIVKDAFSSLLADSHPGVSSGFPGGIHMSAATGTSGAVFGMTAQAAGIFGKAKAGVDVLTAKAGAKANVKVDKDGVEANASAEASAAALKGHASVGGKYGEASVNTEIFSAAAGVSATGAVSFKDGKLSGKAEVSADASVAAAKGDVEGKLGTKKFNAHGKASGAVAGAGAKAKAGVEYKDGAFSATAKAGAEAYLAKGEVKGGYTFMGIKVDLEVNGQIGVQAKAGGEVSSTSVGLDVGLGPVGGKIKIDWSDFDWKFWK